MIRRELLEAFEMVEQKSVAAKTKEINRKRQQSQIHLSKLISEYSETDQLSWRCRAGGVHPNTARRWAKQGVAKLREEIVSFMKACGYDPASIFEPSLRPLSIPVQSSIPQAPAQQDRAEKLAKLLVELAASNIASDRDLSIIEGVLHSISRSASP